jgi:hypothetical protein
VLRVQYLVFPAGAPGQNLEGVIHLQRFLGKAPASSLPPPSPQMEETPALDSALHWGYPSLIFFVLLVVELRAFLGR